MYYIEGDNLVINFSPLLYKLQGHMLKNIGLDPGHYTFPPISSNTSYFYEK